MDGESMPVAEVEVRRKGLHLVGLTVPVLYWLADKELTLAFVGTCLFIFTAFEFYRIRHGIPVREADAVARPLMRPHEERGIGAHVFWTAGAFVAILAYPKEIVIIALLISTLADGGAAVVGMRWGRHKLRGEKTLEGSLALFSIAFVIALAVSITFLELVDALVLALLGASAAACIELVPINDNLSIPIFAGFVMTAFYFTP
jgi:dolichol kinase